ncbi:MAG TPA: serine/threonine-protein kinase [Kofleriaceae bacterium]|nr:serine/threonine-protein kinase [Kofleriaceae bacterium]
MTDDDRTRKLGPRTELQPEPHPTPADLESGETLPVLGEIMGPSSPALRLGTRVGRYLLEEELGRGGMGVVFAAHDPELDRKVAIKLLRTAAAEGTEGKARLGREAQALAKLAHPNVIGVFDVGTAGDDVFIAMEMVSGGTLRAYQQGKAWAAIVMAYVQAGRGLAAAHAAGLVHRDFKADNVLVGEDGRMRVTDFGLVRASDGRETSVRPVNRAKAARPGTPLSSELTEAGLVVGTPMYMAPEQLTGRTVGPAADQFALAVSLWQALHGEPPFLAADLAARVDEIESGRRRPPRNRAVPKRVNRAVLRAMSALPAERWPTLTALLDELERSTRSRTPWVAAGGAAAVAAGAIAFLALSGGEAPPCDDADAAGAGLWARHRGDVERAFAATGAPFAAGAFAYVDERLRVFERDWRGAAISACKDTRVRKAQSEAVLDQRLACLTTRRHRAVAMVAALERAKRSNVDDVDVVMRDLPRLEECSDAEVLAGKAPRPDDAARRAALTALEERIAAIRGNLDMLSDEAARAAAATEADTAVKEAVGLGYAPTQAEALITRAEIARQRGKADDARRDLVEAAAAGTRGGDREAVASAYLDLLFLDADVRADFAGADSWSQLAGAAVDAIGGPPGKRADLAEFRAILARARGDYTVAADILRDVVDDESIAPELRGLLQGDLANILTDAGDYDAAEKLFDEIIPARSEALGADHPKVLGLRANRANLFYYRGDFAKCRDAHAALLPERERALGVNHPTVAFSLQALAVCLNKGGRAKEALPVIERAVTIFTASRGAEHPDTLAAKSDLGGVYSHLGDHARSLAVNEELLAVREKTLGKDHPDVAMTLVNTAIEAKNAGRVAEALAYHERALKIFEASLGKTHPSLGIAFINYGEALRAAERPVDAIAAFERAGKILGPAIGEDHVVMAHVWYGIGLAELARGRANVAVTWLERAVARRDRAGAELDRNEQAEAREALARALVAAGGDRARARTLAEQAIEAWRELGENFDGKRTAAETWRATVK